VTAVARALGRVVSRYDALFARPFPYVMVLHAAPKGEEAHFHFHVEFLPVMRGPDRLKYLAGTELGAGTFTADVLPEDAARALRQVEPILPSFSHLAYTCLLIPRLPTHMLVRGLAVRLREWLPQLCLAYGWRLENLFVRPEYLQWTVQVAPAISPGNVLRHVRQQSSRRIFLQFPQYEVENPSGDFWAPGFLIISGFQPPSKQLVQDFIHQTRTRQGSWTY